MDPEYKYKRIYNPNSNRYQNHNYSENGYYFITICTKDRENFFGNIVNGRMVLNGIGEIVEDDILKLPNYHENLEIDEFVIMPNHLHLIIVLNTKNISKYPRRDVSLKRLDIKEKQDIFIKQEKNVYFKQEQGILIKQEQDILIKQEQDILIKQEQGILIKQEKDVSEKRLYDNSKENFSNISPKKGNIGNIIKLFKGYLSKKINKKYSSHIFNFAWQKNYYDRIIRNEKELFNVRKYIQENPQKWELDENNPVNIK